MGEGMVVDVGIGAVRAGELAYGRCNVVVPGGDGRVRVSDSKTGQQSLMTRNERDVIGAVVGDAEQADK